MAAAVRPAATLLIAAANRSSGHFGLITEEIAPDLGTRIRTASALLQSPLVVLARAAYPQPVKDWIPLIGVVIGVLAGFAGTWLTQRSAQRLERTRFEHEQAKAREAERHQAFLEILEYVEDRMAWLTSVEDLTAYEPSNIGTHPALVAAKVKIFGSEEMEIAWWEFRELISAVMWSFAQGNVIVGDGDPNAGKLSDRTQIPRTLHAGEIVILAVKAQLWKDSFVDLALDDDFLLGKYELRKIHEEWLEDTLDATEPWWNFFASSGDKELREQELAPRPLSEMIKKIIPAATPKADAVELPQPGPQD
jgi:hypothetical protein